MSNSSLVDYINISPNKTSPRNGKIDTISIHCTAGGINKTAEQIANLSHFVNYDNKKGASCNYAIGGDGSIALIVDEKDRSWCTSSRDNDNRSVTIEVASTNVSLYKVSDKAYNTLVILITDICKRNGIKELKWQGDKSLIGQVEKQNLTVHRWFANKACPGEYLYNLHFDIALKVNELLKEGKKEMFKVGELTILNGQDYQREAIISAVEQGIFKGDGDTLDVSKSITIGDFCLVLKRLGIIK